MSIRWALFVALGFWVLGCANPLNRATSNRYSRMCGEAEANGRLDIAEEACRRALINVDWGNLSKFEESQKAYNLARIKRRVGKFVEALELLQHSLEIEEGLEDPSDLRIGRRLAEVAANYWQMDLVQKGTPYVKRLYPLADLYSGFEREMVARIFYAYSMSLKESDAGFGRVLETRALEMGFDPSVIDE